MRTNAFDNPPHELRYGYGTVRNESEVVERNVLEVTYLPPGLPKKNNRPIKTVASVEFLIAMESYGYSISKPIGKLVNAVYGRLGRSNKYAFEVAGSSASHYPIRGPFYWVDMAPRGQTWWRMSLRLDFEKMPCVKQSEGGNRQDYMRRTLAKQITQDCTVGPFFVETIWNTQDGNHYWFDIYVRDERDLVAIQLMF